MDTKKWKIVIRTKRNPDMCIEPEVTTRDVINLLKNDKDEDIFLIRRLDLSGVK